MKDKTISSYPARPIYRFSRTWYGAAVLQVLLPGEPGGWVKCSQQSMPRDHFSIVSPGEARRLDVADARKATRTSNAAVKPAQSP